MIATGGNHGSSSLSRGNSSWALHASAILTGCTRVGALPEDLKGGLWTYDLLTYGHYLVLASEAVAHLFGISGYIQALLCTSSVRRDHDRCDRVFGIPDFCQVPCPASAAGRW